MLALLGSWYLHMYVGLFSCRTISTFYPTWSLEVCLAPLRVRSSFTGIIEIGRRGSQEVGMMGKYKLRVRSGFRT